MGWTERELVYRDGDCTCRGHLVVAGSAERRPGILVAPSGAGLGEPVIDRARMLADLGYTALAVDFYGGRRLAAGIDEAHGLLAPFMADQALLRRRIRTAFDALVAAPEVDARRIGAIGFCFGGKAVLELARSGAPVAATVAFHGLLRTDNIDNARNIRGAILVCAGANDDLVPLEDLLAFAREMKTASIDWQLHVHGGAKHAFTNPHVSDENGLFGYHRDADRRSWGAMRALFLETFDRAHEQLDPAL